MKLKLTLLSAILSFSFVSSASDYYWVGGTGNWSDFANHWATSSGGGSFHTQVPQTTDNVFFDANSFNASNQVVTVDQAVVSFRNMDWTGTANDPKLFALTGNRFMIYGSLTLIPGMTAFFSGEIRFEGTTTGQTITLGGKTLSIAIFNGIGGGWTFQDTFNSSIIILNHGSLNTNSQTVNAGFLSNTTATVRSLTMGSTVFTSNGWTITDKTNFTLDAGTSNILVNGTMSVGGLIFHNAKITSTLTGAGGNFFNEAEFTGSNSSIQSNNTFNILKISSGATVGGNNTINNLILSPGFVYSFNTGTVQTFNSLQANGDCNNLITLKSSSPPGQASFVKTSGSVTASYISLQGIAATGGAIFTANNSINLGSNSGWIINSPASQNLYWIGGTGNWNDGNHWSTSSGGSPLGCSPTLQDNVFFDANSFTATNQTVLVNQPIISFNNMDWSGVTNNPKLAATTGYKAKVYGSLTFTAGMSADPFGEFNFEATTTGHTITQA